MFRFACTCCSAARRGRPGIGDQRRLWNGSGGTGALVLGYQSCECKLEDSSAASLAIAVGISCFVVLERVLVTPVAGFRSSQGGGIGYDRGQVTFHVFGT